jgi:hypothetical protein
MDPIERMRMPRPLCAAAKGVQERNNEDHGLANEKPAKSWQIVLSSRG